MQQKHLREGGREGWRKGERGHCQINLSTHFAIGCGVQLLSLGLQHAQRVDPAGSGSRVTTFLLLSGWGALQQSRLVTALYTYRKRTTAAQYYIHTVSLGPRPIHYEH